MSESTDTELAFKVQKVNDEEALGELISRHSGIYVDMIRKFGGKSLTENQVADLMGEKDFNIYKAAIEYNPDKSKFSTFLAIKTKYLCLTSKTVNKKTNHFVDFDEESFRLASNSVPPDEASADNEIIAKLYSIIDRHPDKLVRQIFEERYFSGKNNKLKSWKEISKSVGLSIQGVINIHNRTLPEFQKQLQHAEITF